MFEILLLWVELHPPKKYVEILTCWYPRMGSYLEREKIDTRPLKAQRVPLSALPHPVADSLKGSIYCCNALTICYGLNCDFPKI